MNEALDIELGRTNVIIVERLHRLRLCVTLDPSDDRDDIIARFKPEGVQWNFQAIEDFGDYVYLHYQSFHHPSL